MHLWHPKIIVKDSHQTLNLFIAGQQKDGDLLEMNNKYLVKIAEIQEKKKSLFQRVGDVGMYTAGTLAAAGLAAHALGKLKNVKFLKPVVKHEPVDKNYVFKGTKYKGPNKRKTSAGTTAGNALGSILNISLPL